MALFGHITGSIEWSLYTGLTAYIYINQTRLKILRNPSHFLFLLLLLPIIDLLQQFEDYVKGIVLRKRKKK